MKKFNFLIDFDSTLVRFETLEVLADVAVDNAYDRDKKLADVAALTDRAMNGDIDFRVSLDKRLALIKAKREHLGAVIDTLKSGITASFVRNRAFLAANAERIFIVSNGFREIIEPVVESLGLRADHVYANTLAFDRDGSITGFDATNPLADGGGKIDVAKQLCSDRDLVVVGDGFSDYEVRAAGAARRFYAFTENVARPRIVEAAKRIAPNFDEVLFDCGETASVSYPKNRIDVLLLENIHSDAADIFNDEGFHVRTLSGGIDDIDLERQLEKVSVLGIRSKTRLTREVIANANLLALGAFCIGTNQIDLDAAARRGTAAFNAPYGNTRSVVELTLAEIVLLMRRLPDKLAAMHQGRWTKSASGSYEVRGKTLGIVGYGNIGMQLSVLAEAMGMRVLYFDLAEKLALGTARKCATLEELLQNADVVSVHIDGRRENTNLFGSEAFKTMRPGAIFLNLSRGHVVDVEALRDAVAGRHLAGAGVDVFPSEPLGNKEPFRSPLAGLANVALTPHIGGSTQEAQVNIARFVARRLVDYINTGSTEGSVNLPNIRLPGLGSNHRLIHIHHNEPGILASINGVLAEHRFNINGQYLKTDERLGYVITDVDAVFPDAALADMKAIDSTIRARVLY